MLLVFESSVNSEYSKTLLAKCIQSQIGLRVV